MKRSLIRHLSYLLFAIGVTATQGEWLSKYLFIDGNTNTSPFDIVTDKSGNPHVAYIHKKQLFYGYLDDGVWKFILVKSDIENDVYDLSLDLDSNQLPHIVYSMGSSIFYTTKSNNVWVTEEIESSGWKPQVLITPSNDVIIVFYGGSYTYSAKMYLRKKQEDLWVKEEIFSKSLRYPSFHAALDSMNHIHVLYSDNSAEKLRYSHQNVQGWEHEELTNAISSRPQILIAKNDSVHIAYNNKTSSGSFEIIYAQQEGANWSFTSVTNRGSSDLDLCISPNDELHLLAAAGQNSTKGFIQKDQVWENLPISNPLTDEVFARHIPKHAMVIDQFGISHILAYSSLEASLVYLNNRSNIKWNHKGLITPPNSLNFYCADIDHDGVIHTLYYDNSTSTTKYGTYTNGSWAFSDTTLPALQYAVLKVDDNGKVHVAALADVTPNYYYLESGTWTEEVIESNTFVGGNYSTDQRPRFSLALDSGNNPHVSFVSDSTVKYAKKSHDAGWSITSISSADSSQVTELKLDSSDQPHITFSFDDGSRKIAYRYYSNGQWLQNDIENLDLWSYERPAMEIDHQGNAHIIFRRFSDLIHAHLKEGAWQMTTLDNNASSHPITIEMDRYGQLHTVYQSYVFYPYEYVRKAHFNGDDWGFDLITNGRKSFQNAPWFGIANDGAVHVLLDPNSTAWEPHENGIYHYCETDGFVSYTNWVINNFTTEEISEGIVTRPNVVSGPGTLTNFDRYTHNLSRTTSFTPSANCLFDADGNLGIEFTQQRNRLDCNINIDASSNLLNWETIYSIDSDNQCITNAPINLFQSDTDLTRKHYLYDKSYNPTLKSKRYLRCNVIYVGNKVEPEH